MTMGFLHGWKREDNKEDSTTVVVFSEDRVLAETKNKNIAWLLEKPAVMQKAETHKRIAPARMDRTGGDAASRGNRA